MILSQQHLLWLSVYITTSWKFCSPFLEKKIKIKIWEFYRLLHRCWENRKNSFRTILVISWKKTSLLKVLDWILEVANNKYYFMTLPMYLQLSSSLLWTGEGPFRFSRAVLSSLWFQDIWSLTQTVKTYCHSFTWVFVVSLVTNILSSASQRRKICH